MKRSRLVRLLHGTQLEAYKAKGLTSGKHAKRKKDGRQAQWPPDRAGGKGRQQGQGRLRAHARIAFDKFDGSGNLAAKAGFFGEFTFHAGNALDNRGMAAVEFFADFFKS